MSDTDERSRNSLGSVLHTGRHDLGDFTGFLPLEGTGSQALHTLGDRLGNSSPGSPAGIDNVGTGTDNTFQNHIKGLSGLFAQNVH